MTHERKILLLNNAHFGDKMYLFVYVPIWNTIKMAVVSAVCRDLA